MMPKRRDRLPLATTGAWFKVMGILAALIVFNAVVFVGTYAAGVIVTLPLTLFLAFLLLRDLLPRNRLPPGPPPRGIPL